MRPFARRLLQRGFAHLDALQRDAMEIRDGDVAAAAFASFGTGSRIEHPHRLSGNVKAVAVGADTYIRSGLRVEALAPPGALVITIGDHCQLGHDVRLVAVNGITVEDGVGIGHGATVADTIHDYKTVGDDEQPWQAALKVGRPLVIEAGAWIGNNCVVTGGITIGARSIIGANSVISRDVPPDSIVAGNPAKLQRRKRADGSWEWIVDPASVELEPPASS
jgi:acetyltransferase-like isoleucine patch superfamily enzyme